MIFSEEKWNDADEIRPYIGVSTALSFDTIRASLQNAFGLFIRPLVGDKIVTKLVEIYDSVTDISTIKEETADKNLKLLYLAQRSNVFLAFWYDYDEFQMLIGDSGVKRQESDQTKTPYKYQEQSLKDGWKNKGFDALDKLLYFLEKNISDFEDFKDSEYYTESLNSIVRNTLEVNNYYTINNSRLIFLRLKTHFRVIEDTIISPRLGLQFYDSFKKEIAKETPEGKYDKLRSLLIPVVVFYSVCRLIKETGSITDKGLFFQTLKGGEDSYQSLSPVTDERLMSQANRAEADAISYWLSVERYLSKEFDITPAHNKKIPNRNNNGKKSFWA